MDKSVLSSTTWEPEHWDQPGYNHDNFKKTSISFFSVARPHMRAFHFSWFAFFGCFLMWFAIPPLMGTMKKPACLSADSPACMKCLAYPFTPERRASELGNPLAKTKECMKCFPFDARLGAGCGGLGLDKDQILVSNIVSVSGTMLMRVLIGPFADQYGARRTYSALLVILCIPGFLASTVDSFATLLIIRGLISFAGGSFVVTSLWTTAFFHSNCVGFANATTAGWGNLGGGVALEVMPLVYMAFHNAGYSNEKSWRCSLAIPPVLLFVNGILIWFLTDDCPLGDINRLQAHNEKLKQDAEVGLSQEEKDLKPATGGSGMGRSLAIGASNWRTWVCALCYAMSFGAELTVNNNMPNYFQKGFSLNQHDAGLAAGSFGLVNICARSLGGLMSDKFYERWGVRGRLWALYMQTLAMGLLLIGFTTVTKDDGGMPVAMGWLISWAFLTSMTCGGLFSVVPFVEPTAVGGVSGIVGAGGNLGALFGMAIMGIGFRPGFLVIGFMSICSAMAVPLLWMNGHGSMFRGMDATVPDEAEEVPPIEIATKPEPPTNGGLATGTSSIPGPPMQAPVPLFVGGMHGMPGPMPQGNMQSARFFT